MKKNIFEIIDVSNEIYDKGLVSGKAGNRIVLGRLVILPVKTGNIAT